MSDGSGLYSCTMVLLKPMALHTSGNAGKARARRPRVKRSLGYLCGNAEARGGTGAVNAKLKCPLFSKVEMSPFCSSDFSLLREEKTCCLSCGVVGERRASVGSRWATRGGNARSMASRPSALSTGCPHAPKGARRSAGLVHKSTARPPALAASSSGRRARGGLERSPPGMVRRRLVGRPRPLSVIAYAPAGREF